MHLTQAYDLLEITPDMTVDEMKRQYKKKALRFHPDKNKSADASDRFREIHEAYQTVLNAHSSDDSDADISASGAFGAYKDLFFSFLSHFFSPSDESDPVFTVKLRMVFSRLICMCESKAIDYIQKLDRDVLLHIHSVVHQSREIFHFSDLFLQSIERILSTRSEKEPHCLLVNPSLEDLLEDNLYRFTRNGISYVVPLWHHELIYDASGSELVVQCAPVLPEHMDIDEDNHLIIYVEYDIREIWGKSTVDVAFGGKIVSFTPSTLHLTSDTQTVIFSHMGISRINADHVFDVSVKQNVVLKIQLFME